MSDEDECEDYDIDLTIGDKRIRLNLNLKEWIVICGFLLLSGYVCKVTGLI